MTSTARHAATRSTDRLLSTLKAAAAVLAIVAVGLAYVLLSAMTVAPAGTSPTDPRCALTTLTADQCALGFADNGVNGDN